MRITIGDLNQCRNRLRRIQSHILDGRVFQDDVYTIEESIAFLDELHRRLDRKLDRWWDDDSPQAEMTFGVRKDSDDEMTIGGMCEWLADNPCSWRLMERS